MFKTSAYTLTGLALLSSPALATEEDAGAFWREEAMKSEFVKVNNVPQKKKVVIDQITAVVKKELGEQWVASALKIAKVESGYNCKATGPKTRHGHAKGVFQLIDSSARSLGFDPAKMHDCNENIAAGVAHMKVCIKYGVKDPRGMAACHVAGWNHWNVKLARQHERYKQRYINMATA
jgi:hypothetical protein